MAVHISAAQARVLRTLRDVRCVVEDQVTISEYAGGGIALIWSDGRPCEQFLSVATFRALKRLELIRFVRQTANDHLRYGLSEQGRQALAAYELA